MFTLHETILSYMKLSGNAKQTGYPQLREAVELSWYKLFKKTRESIIRKWVNVEHGMAEIPCSMENLLGIYDVDDCGNLSPFYEDNAKNTLTRPSLKCTCSTCDEDECMCPAVLDAIPVQTDVIIDGEIYTNKTVTKVLKNGEIVEYKVVWTPSYNALGELEDVVAIETQTTKCNLAVKSCGCLINSNENIEKIVGCGCIISECAPYFRDRYPALYNANGYYKFDHQLKTLTIFDNQGKKSKIKQVIIVFQSNGADMLVPEYARPALIGLLDWTKKMYSPLYNFNDRQEAKWNFNREKNEMLRYLHPIPFEWVTQSGDHNAMQSRPNRSIPAHFSKKNEEAPAPSCNIPLTGAAAAAGGGSTVINNTYNTIISTDSQHDFLVENDDDNTWVFNSAPDLRCNRITNIWVDGIKRKITVVTEDTITPPADNSFYWKEASATLIYAPGLLKDAWVEFSYRAVQNCTPV